MLRRLSTILYNQMHDAWMMARLRSRVSGALFFCLLVLYAMSSSKHTSHGFTQSYLLLTARSSWLGIEIQRNHYLCFFCRRFFWLDPGFVTTRDFWMPIDRLVRPL